MQLPPVELKNLIDPEQKNYCFLFVLKILIEKALARGIKGWNAVKEIRTQHWELGSHNALMHYKQQSL